MPEFMTRTWEDNREHYAELVSHHSLKPIPAVAAMLDLVKAIEQSRYACGLYAWTSMHDLCIVQTPVVHPYQGPFLRISPTSDGNLDFRYIDTISEHHQWHRVVAPELGFSRLEHFLKQLHWFTLAE